MPKLILEYGRRSTDLERLESLAKRHEITREELAKRLISEGLGAHALNPISDSEEVGSLDELFQKQGLIKPKS